MRNKVIFAGMLCLTLAGCYYDVEEELYGSSTCDTAAPVTFSATVNSILQNYGCLGCHSGGAPSGGVNLQSYTNVHAKVQDGRLAGAINHSSGFSPMPKGGNKMTQCDINKIQAWIDAGAPNN